MLRRRRRRGRKRLVEVPKPPGWVLLTCWFGACIDSIEVGGGEEDENEFDDVDPRK